MADTRVSYDASETELATIAQIKTHLSTAFGKEYVVTNADVLTYSLLTASELLEECQHYAQAMPYQYSIQGTRLERFLS
jgi:hypothetical protein